MGLRVRFGHRPFATAQADHIAEIMPLSIRGRGSAFATGIGNWLVGTIWSQVSPIGLGKITYRFYFIFVAFNLCVTLPTIFFVFKVGFCEQMT